MVHKYCPNPIGHQFGRGRDSTQAPPAFQNLVIDIPLSNLPSHHPAPSTKTNSGTSSITAPSRATFRSGRHFEVKRRPPNPDFFLPAAILPLDAVRIPKGYLRCPSWRGFTPTSTRICPEAIGTMIVLTLVSPFQHRGT